MSKRMLVVEDQENNRQIIRDMLSATDYEITEVRAGAGGITKERPGLILMDIQFATRQHAGKAARVQPDGW